MLSPQKLWLDFNNNNNVYSNTQFEKKGKEKKKVNVQDLMFKKQKHNEDSNLKIKKKKIRRLENSET